MGCGCSAVAASIPLRPIGGGRHCSRPVSTRSRSTCFLTRAASPRRSSLDERDRAAATVHPGNDPAPAFAVHTGPPRRLRRHRGCGASCHWRGRCFGALRSSGCRASAAGRYDPRPSSCSCGPRGVEAALRQIPDRRVARVGKASITYAVDRAAVAEPPRRALAQGATGRAVGQLTLQRQVAHAKPLDPRPGANGEEVWGDPSLGFVGRADGGGPAGGFGAIRGRSASSPSGMASPRPTSPPRPPTASTPPCSEASRSSPGWRCRQGPMGAGPRRAVIDVDGPPGRVLGAVPWRFEVKRPNEEVLRAA